MLDVLVYDIGTIVAIGLKDESIDGVVAEVSISNGPHVHYKVIWWSGRERREAWLEAFEIVTRSKPTVRIGFN